MATHLFICLCFQIEPCSLSYKGSFWLQTWQTHDFTHSALCFLYLSYGWRNVQFSCANKQLWVRLCMSINVSLFKRDCIQISYVLTVSITVTERGRPFTLRSWTERERKREGCHCMAYRVLQYNDGYHCVHQTRHLFQMRSTLLHTQMEGGQYLCPILGHQHQ